MTTARTILAFLVLVFAVATGTILPVDNAFAQGATLDRFRVTTSLVPGIFTSRAEAEAALRAYSPEASVLQLIGRETTKNTTTYSYAVVPSSVDAVRSSDQIFRAERAPAFTLQNGPEFSSEEALTQALIDLFTSNTAFPPAEGCPINVEDNFDWFYLTQNWIFFPVYGHTDSKEIRITWFDTLNPDGTCTGIVNNFNTPTTIYRSYEIQCPPGYTLNATSTFCENNLTATITEVNLDYDLEPEECVGNPCNPWTGSKILSFRDVELPGITFDRVWRSKVSERIAYAGDPVQNESMGVMPYGWSYSYGQRILFDNGGLPEALYRPDGTLVPVEENPNEAGVYLASNGSEMQLRSPTPGSWILHMPDGSSEAYGRRSAAECADGVVRLEYVTDPAGRRTTVEYASECSRSPDLIRGPFGHTLQIEYQPNAGPAEPRSISRLVDGGGRSSSYNYSLAPDPAGASVQLLDSVSYPDNTVETYHYEDGNFPRFITGVTDEAGIRVSTYSYDSAGRTSTTSWAGGFNSWSFNYRSNGEIHAVDGRGLTTVYAELDSDFDGQGDRRVVIRQSRIVKDTTSNEDGQQRRTSRSDTNFLRASYGFDDYHMTSMLVTGGIDSREYAYEHLNDTSSLKRFERGPSSCDDGAVPSRQQETETVYLPGTQLVAAVIERGFRKDDSGACVPIERTTTYAGHNPFGQPTLIDGPRTDVVDTVRVSYNECTVGGSCGRPASVENALGHRWTFDSYDDRGNLLQMTRADGVSITYAYDSRDRVIAKSETSADGLASRTTGFSYYANGLVRRVTDPTGGYFDYVYDDARNLRQIVDPFGDRIVYDYDANGNRTLEQHLDAAGVERFRRGYGYDFFDRVNREILPSNNGGPDDEWQWVKDATGLLQSATDPLGRVTSFVEYDDFRNLTEVVDADGGITRYAYDPNDNLVSATAPNGAVTTYEYDDFGNVTREAGPDRGTIVYTYDDAGNRIAKTDARGRLTTFRYDALDRIELVTFADGEAILYEYDLAPGATGRLGRITDATGATAWSYDGFGQPARKVQTIGTVSLATDYAYDVQGRLQSMTLPSGRVVSYSYDLWKVVGVSVDGATVLSGATYEPFGPVNGWVWGNGDVADRTYNLRGLLSSYSVGGEPRNLAYDATGQLVSATGGSSAETYEYDALGRLSGFVPGDSPGTSAGFATPPVLLTSIQTMRNESGAVPGEPSMPWLTVATKNVSETQAKIALERGQVNTGTVELRERIGYVAIEPTSGGSFLTSDERFITFEAQTTPEFILGWGNGCFESPFLNIYETRPLVVASLNTHNGPDGGWLRRCSLNRGALGLTVDEDKFGDPERRHGRAESAGFVAFSDEFASRFTDENGTWSMEMAKIRLPSTRETPVFTRVTFRQSYTTRPVVVVMPNKSGSNPASVRIRRVTRTGFEIAQVEPAPNDGTHVAMPVHYLAVEPGTHTLPNGTKMEVGQKWTRKQQHGSGVTGEEGWATIRYSAEAPVTSLVPQQFTYDGNANRTSLTEDGTAYSYAYAIDSNRLVGTSGPVAKTISYDASGNITGDGSRSYQYDDRGRLVGVDFGAATYQYNGLGQRVHKDAGQTTLFVYGTGGELLGEYDESGNPVAEHIWFSGSPVAVVDAGGMYYVHTDHLGTPRAVVDGNAVVWRWTSDPFGAAEPQDDPDDDGAAFTYNLRFPGQYYDAETGLHYNYFRTYDPSTGRYLESDPIGLRGGLNTYAYAAQNPTKYFDLFGLDIFDDVIPDGGFPNELVCRQTLRNACNVAKQACQIASCPYGAPSTCKYPCAVAASECKVQADEFCAGQDFSDEPGAPPATERVYDSEGCYFEYRRTWYGKRQLTKVCPGDKDYKGEQCEEDPEG